MQNHDMNIIAGHIYTVTTIVYIYNSIFIDVSSFSLQIEEKKIYFYKEVIFNCWPRAGQFQSSQESILSRFLVGNWGSAEWNRVVLLDE